jgi:asparagine synthase (glutamine-hydrolysing)
MAAYLPEQVLHRKKSPYPKTWDPAYRQLMEQKLQAELADPFSPLWQLVDGQAVKKMISDELPVPWYGQLMRSPQTMAYLLQLAYWLKQYQVEILET